MNPDPQSEERYLRSFIQTLRAEARRMAAIQTRAQALRDAGLIDATQLARVNATLATVSEDLDAAAQVLETAPH